jgi:hypothetical protein
MKVYRQGDVLIKRVLAFGEVTGHCHKVENLNQAEVLEVAKKLAEDEFGELYQTEITGDEPICMIKLVNSTPGPDGEFKNYWLRVPPDMKTARQAVAWTFGMTPDEYAKALVQET